MLLIFFEVYKSIQQYLSFRVVWYFLWFDSGYTLLTRISHKQCCVLLNGLYLEGYDVYLPFTGDVNFDYVEKVLYYFFNINLF